MDVKCLSIKNPVSYLVASGIKDVENRTWKTDYRGWLYIHSSGDKDYFFIDLDDYPDVGKNINFYDEIKTPDTPEYVYRYEKFLSYMMDFYGEPDMHNSEKLKAAYKKAKDFICVSRSIIGRVKLVNIVKDSQSPFAFKNYYHWILKDAELFKRPVPQINGKLGLFNFEIPESYLSSDNIL